MNKLKKQIAELRKTTPKHIQWLLLAAAFIVMLILLTLLIGGGDKKSEIPDVTTPDAILKFKPELTDPIDWTQTVVGDEKTETFEITSTYAVKIDNFKVSKEIPGFKSPVSNCKNMAQIDGTIPCTLKLTYAPTAAAETVKMAFIIIYHKVNEPEDMEITRTINIELGAKSPEPKPQTKPEPEPEPEPVKQEIKSEIESIAPTPVFEPELEPVVEEAEEEVIEYEPAPVPAAKPAPAPAPQAEITPAPEACSDFAFPGYDMSGNQIGWIKPERGAYYFHPFSDKECNDPTGTYNPDTGIISDIDNRGKKIGTDAEHIGMAASVVARGVLPELSNPAPEKPVNLARELGADQLVDASGGAGGGADVFEANHKIELKADPNEDPKKYTGGALDEGQGLVVSSMPYDRRFILRQFKPIPATIVSEILADRAALEEGLPVRATVDRNVYSDDGRTVIIPTGTLMLGYVTGEIPGPYKAIGRMNINWYQFILPNGVEFNFPSGEEPFSGDSQGRSGVPGRGSTDYFENFITPMLTAMVPAAVNLIAPISDRFVNQIDLDNNTVVQSGTMRSSEMAKSEIISAWNQVAQKLLVDMMDNTVPPFSIAAGTRITVYSPVDLMVTCGEAAGKKCSIHSYGENKRRDWRDFRGGAGALTDDNAIGGGRSYDYKDESYIGQVRSFDIQKWCTTDNNGKVIVNKEMISEFTAQGYAYGAVQLICEQQNYQAVYTAKKETYQKKQQEQFTKTYGSADGRTEDQEKAYNTDILGMTYNDEGVLEDPFAVKQEVQAAAAMLTCEDGTAPDANGCCTDEVYTDMGEQGFNCCPPDGGNCFPPLLMN